MIFPNAILEEMFVRWWAGLTSDKKLQKTVSILKKSLVLKSNSGTYLCLYYYFSLFIMAFLDKVPLCSIDRLFNLITDRPFLIETIHTNSCNLVFINSKATHSEI